MSEEKCEPLPWPVEDEDIRAALAAAYADGSWGKYHGPNGAALVDELCAAFAVEHALLCSSGTIGVELALRGCGVEAGDEVVLAGYDFPGNFRAVEAIGARPLLVDVSADSWCLDVAELDSVASDGVKAVIATHLHGGLAEIPAIAVAARERGWAVVEDACQQPGAAIDGRPVGSWGDVGVLSFGGSKLLTAGRGGAVLTNDPQILQRIKVFSDRGNQAFPLSELQAAVLRPQLSKLASRNRVRSERIDLLRRQTTGLSDYLRPVASRSGGEPAFYKFAWSYIPAENDAPRREQLVTRLQAVGVPIDSGFRGFVGRSERRCTKVGSLPNSARLSQSTILLHHPLLLAHEKATFQVAKLLNDTVRQLAS